MPLGSCFASFPNSRIRSRKATQTADTGIVSIPASPGPNALIKAANQNRTYLTLRNTGTVPMRYGYVDRGTLYLDGMLLNPGDAVDLESLGAVYGVCVTAGTTEISWDEGVG